MQINYTNIFRKWNLQLEIYVKNNQNFFLSISSRKTTENCFVYVFILDRYVGKT